MIQRSGFISFLSIRCGYCALDYDFVGKLENSERDIKWVRKVEETQRLST